ncbi:SpoIIE family protein phosphatase [Acanthopleuribacter pedis]|uniref:SpoIIE family protein phosphatase n=1 Tax=Acanthopleuribacter pedis TaxID=442870 RepID=A0A8J7QD69_9BACT|nr:SpoIIE family protein phosphatase [Acanthopleuribacter pedis]MBO1318866.1 SpoIIE family protein phosphatase [Acanthopleuribacter pedis]
MNPTGELKPNSRVQRLWLFRITFGAAVLFLLPLSLKNGYNKLNSGIDDNLFELSVGRIYILQPIQAEPIDNTYDFFSPDDLRTIRQGDLLVAVNDRRVARARDAYAVLDRLQPWQKVVLEVQKPEFRRALVRYRVRVGALRRDFLRDIPLTVNVYDILPEGASDRAGIRRGDLILSINGEAIRGLGHADFLVRRSIVGERVPYQFIRNGEMKQTHVVMTRFNIVFLDVVFQLSGLAWILAGLTLAGMRGHLRATRPLSFGFFLIGVACLLIPNRGHLDGQMLQVWREYTLWPSFYFGLGALFHGSYYFPRERRDLLAVPFLRYAYYLVSLAATWVAISTMGMQSMILFVPIMFSLHFCIRFIFRKGASREHARLESGIRYTGIFVSLMTVAGAFFSSHLSARFFYSLIALGLFLLLFAYSYTMMRYRLLGIRIGRVTQFSFVTTFWLVALVTTFISCLLWLARVAADLPRVRLTSRFLEISQAVGPHENMAGHNMVLMFCGIGVAFVFFYAGRLGLNGIRRRFHRQDYDHQGASNELVHLMTSVVSLDELAGGMVAKMAAFMRVKQLGLIIFRDEQECACQAWSHKPRGGSESPLTPEQVQLLGKNLRQYRAELCVDYLEPVGKEALVAQGFKYVYPIYSKSRFLGFLLIGEKLSETTFEPKDFQFLAATAKQAAIAVENAFLYELVGAQERMKHELALARQIQLSSLPQQDPELPGFDIAGVSLPALEVGGDFYGYNRAGDDFFSVVLGDVSGKGTSAALHMSRFQGIFSTLASDDRDLQDLFVRLNHLLYAQLDKNAFISALGIRIDLQGPRLQTVRAGHLPLLWYRAADKEVHQIKPGGIALGVDPGPLFERVLECSRHNFDERDIFVLISDGINETHNHAHQEFGLERVCHIIRHHADASAAALRDVILHETDHYAAGLDRHDDQTVVVVKVLPSAPSVADG